MAVVPVKPVVTVMKSSVAILSFHYSATVPVSGSDVVLMNPRNRQIETSRLSILANTAVLRINNTGMDDSGNYTITISKVIGGSSYTSSAMIILNVEGTVCSFIASWLNYKLKLTICESTFKINLVFP